MALSALPEELLLRVCSCLHRLDDFYAVMLTSKQLLRISQDVTAGAISRMALRTGDFLPGLRPHSHFLLVATARRLSQWARQSREHRQELKAALKCGVSSLTAFALSVVPVTLDGIRETWRWKNEVLNPLNGRLQLSCGRTSKDDLTSCEDPEVALFQWAIYGELFDHLPSYTDTTAQAGLDSVTRFRYMTYCVPDRNCFYHLGIEAPEWFKATPKSDTEAYNQLSLREALRSELTVKAFREAITYLTDLELSADSGESGAHALYNEESLYVQRVMNSGKHSLEVLRYAGAETQDNAQSLDATSQWLLDLKASQDSIMDAAKMLEDLFDQFNARDPWLDAHVPSLHKDLQFTLWNNMRYEYNIDGWQDDASVDRALKQAIAA